VENKYRWKDWIGVERVTPAKPHYALYNNMLYKVVDIDPIYLVDSKNVLYKIYTLYGGKEPFKSTVKARNFCNTFSVYERELTIEGQMTPKQLESLKILYGSP